MTDPVPAANAVQPAEQVRRTAIAAAALAQSGLFYAVNDYDTDRYRKLASLAAELLAAVTDDGAAHWELQLGHETGYATPKVDVRGALVDDRERILLMRERSDGRWSLPGGWADPLDTPSRAVEREILEETGYSARAVKLVGCWDRDTQGHLPRLPFSIYKLFFLCEATATCVRRMRWKPWRSAGSVWVSCRSCQPAGSANGSSAESSRTTETRCCPPSSTSGAGGDPVSAPGRSLLTGWPCRSRAGRTSRGS